MEHNITNEFNEINTSILSLDISAYTQNILLFNSYDYYYKLHLPSPSLILANRIKKFTNEKKHVVLSGETMGGGAINLALFDHIKAGLKVYMTSRAAMTVRDNLTEVKKKGINIIEEEEVEQFRSNEEFEILSTWDINRHLLESTLTNYNINLNPEIVTIAVEDHGIAKTGQTDREGRFEYFREVIPNNISRFCYPSPPDFYSRMMAVKRTLNSEFPDAKHLIMDSKIAAMYGALKSAGEKSAITIDAGIGHTIVALFEDENITGLFEHHTRFLEPVKLRKLIYKFQAGELTNDEIVSDGGHGCYINNPITNNIPIIATGPMRKLFEGSGLNVEFEYPIGDIMSTRNVGLIECAKKIFS
jgi:uncharacterized protein (DUF1786 family)